ncbi:GYD domain-containing protein [Natronococcus roseus]|uniref:GYD domain-containing protein n=1 Tax=Natronococcus roseus TaxID=1052014 RepID=UPI00374D7361
MPTFASVVELADRDVQNMQELASIWGEIRTEFEEHDTTLEDSYAMLGEHDFLVIFEAPDQDAAYKAALTMHRHGLDAQTMALKDTDDFADLVDEV